VFDFHISVLHRFISKLQPTRSNVVWFIYFYKFSTCIRRFLSPSSGAPNCTYSFRYCQPILLLAEETPETCTSRAFVQINQTLHLVGCNLETLSGLVEMLSLNTVER